MKYENLKQELGNLIQYCTNENFSKGYDPIGDIIDNAEVELDNLELLRDDAEIICNYQEQQCDLELYYFDQFNSLLKNYRDKDKVLEFKKLLIEYLKPVNSEKIEKFITTEYNNSTNVYLMTAALIYVIGEYRSFYWGGSYDELSDHSYKFLMSLFEDED